MREKRIKLICFQQNNILQCSVTGSTIGFEPISEGSKPSTVSKEVKNDKEKNMGRKR